MKNQGELVKAIRQSLGLTLEKFGKRLGVGKSAISKIENGENNLSDQMLKAICNEYHVNRDYLEYGVGDMFVRTPLSFIDELCDKYNLDDFDRAMLQEYLLMDDESRDVLKNYLRKFADRISKDKSKEIIDKKVASYKAELEAQAASGKLSQSPIGDAEGA